MEKRSIYPWQNGLRVGGAYSGYAKIAIEHYYIAKDKYDELVGISEEYSELCEPIQSNSVISTIFSAMCIESFLNNYAAACLGDDDFYDNFDKLSPESKLQLIAKFILKKEIEKGSAVYSSFKSLFKDRNLYVHNKSKGYSWEKLNKSGVAYMTLEQLNDLDEHPENYETLPCDTVKWEYEKKCILSARNGILAMKEVAAFFDKNDANAYATVQLFNPYAESYIDCAISDEEFPFIRVVRDFRIVD